MAYIALNYMKQEYLVDDEKGLWSMYREGAVMLGNCQGIWKQSRGSVMSGELGGVLEDSPGLTLPLGRGHP